MAPLDYDKVSSTFVSTWPERRINSLQDIHQLAVDIGARWLNSNRCLFRGHSSAAWSLQPFLARELAGNKIDWTRYFGSSAECDAVALLEWPNGRCGLCDERVKQTDP
jgi:hypothetical protein